MEAATILNLVSTIAIVGSLLFAAVQIRDGQRERSRDAQMVLANSFATPAFMDAMYAVLDLPDDLSRVELIEHLKGHESRVWYWLGAMEGLGLLVFHRAVAMELVDQAYAGPIMISWRKLSRYCTDRRDEAGREAQHEWFQWLAERIAEYEVRTNRAPAQIEHRDWVP